jgi:hypothetical protein
MILHLNWLGPQAKIESVNENSFKYFAESLTFEFLSTWFSGYWLYKKYTYLPVNAYYLTALDTVIIKNL